MMANESQAISNVYRQLQNGFCPAVRTVVQTGANLLTIRAAYAKAFDAHLRGLQELARSGANVCEESNRFAAELAEISNTFMKINNEDEKLFLSFANVMAAVTKFSETERDRLKELNLKYSKDEKAVMKSVKRSGDGTALQEFHSNEAKKVKEQHSQRYAYFSKNYLELLRKQSECSKKNVEIAEKQLLESDAADVVKRLEEVVKSNDTIKSTPNDEHLLARDPEPELYERPIDTDANQAPIVMGAKNSFKSQKAEDKSRRNTGEPKVATSVQTTDDLVAVESRPNTVASRISSGSELNTGSYGQSSPAPPPRKILSPNIYKPTPILGLMQAEYEEHQRSMDEIPKVSQQTSNGDQWDRPTYEYERDYPKKKDHDYFDAIPRPDYIPEQQIYQPPKSQPSVVKQRYHPDYAPQVPPIAPRNKENRSPPPKQAKPWAPPTVPVSDYGSRLVCTQKYEAQGDHQLTLNVGEHVRLVKSGSRGWLLVRTSDSRQGWFPQKFLATD